MVAASRSLPHRHRRRNRRRAALAALVVLALPSVAGPVRSSVIGGADAAPVGGDRVALLYEAVFDRAPDTDGLAHWRSVRAGGASLTQLAGTFLASDEFRSRHGQPGAEALVDLLYAHTYGGPGDAEGRAHWVGRLGAGVPPAAVVAAFVDALAGSAPDLLPGGTAEGEVHRLYRAVLRRDPEAAGLRYWTDQRQRGVPLESVAGAIMASPEFHHRYGAASDDQFVDLLYANVLGRGPDAAGRAHWKGQVRAKGRAAVLLGFTESLEFRWLTGTGGPPPPGITSPPATGSTPPATGGAPAPVDTGAGQVLLSVDFDQAPSRGFGSVTREEMGRIFGRPTSCSEPGELSLADGTFRVRFRPNEVGSRRSFCTITLPDGHDELWLRYRVLPEVGWVPVRGGKLAGLAGGAGNTGGNSPAGGEGFSARNMWREGAALVQYTYHQDQPGRFGEDFRYRSGGAAVTLTPGQWRTIVHRVRLNGPGRSDGSITAYVDGVEVMHRGGLVLRGAGHDFSIDKLMLGGFYGGADPSWAPPHTTYVRFDDVVVATGPLR